MKSIAMIAVVAGALAALFAPMAAGARYGFGPSTPPLVTLSAQPSSLVADDRPGAHGIGPSSVITLAADDRTFVRGPGPGAVTLASDDRTFVRGPGPGPVTLVPDDRVGVRGNFEPSPPAQVPTSAAPSNGFDWGDAGIGLGVGMALALLAAGMLVTLRRSRDTLAHT